MVLESGYDEARDEDELEAEMEPLLENGERGDMEEEEEDDSSAKVGRELVE